MEDKKKVVENVQETVDTEKVKQESLKEELEHIRSLQPKVGRGKACIGGGGIMCVCVWGGV